MTQTALLLGWGTLVGTDLISFPQAMVARPLVAGAVAGMIVGDLAAGAMIGVLLELFALDVLPFGGARYPDYGLGAVAGVAAAAGAPGVLGVGVATVVGLATAYVGEWSIHLLRRWNAWDVRRRAVALERGSGHEIAVAHLTGWLRDVLRAIVLTAIGLLLAAAARRWAPVSLRGAVLLTAAMTGVALATAAVGATRLTEQPRGWAWFAVGLGIGVAWVAL